MRHCTNARSIGSMAGIGLAVPCMVFEIFTLGPMRRAV
jgi:hypothetical protein